MRPHRKCHLAVTLVVLASLIQGGHAMAADSGTGPDDAERRRAFELYESGKMVEAMPLLEKLAADHPNDAVVIERWAYSVVSYAATLPDAETRKKARARGRQIALKAKELGDNSPILQIVLEIPEDGSEPTFSERKEVDEAMRSAEASFAQGDLEEARKGYLHALLLDPNNYEATLFIGDVYFRQGEFSSAGEWFAHAVQIDTNRETAYRYWGDALSSARKSVESREKFIEAVIAEPYNQRSWQGLSQWAKQNDVKLNIVRLHDRSSVKIDNDKKVTVTLDSSLNKDDPNLVAWLAYGVGRSAWYTEKYRKDFPNVTRDRQTMQEEAHALQLMITAFKEQKDYASKLTGLDSSLQELIKIQEAGFLEPFVFLNRANPDIAQDYEAYRAANRDRIRRYLDEYVVPKAH